MKKNIFFILSIIFCLMLTGCGQKKYNLKKTMNEIQGIDIIFAQNSKDYEVIKSLPAEEKESFIEELSKLEFSKYVVGDPMSVYGEAVKITYNDNSYEVICYYWAEYIDNGNQTNIKMYCDEHEFKELLDSFCKDNR